MKLSLVSQMMNTKALGMLTLSAALLGSGALVMGGSNAAFSGATENTSSWDSGVVTLSNSEASAMFNATDIVPKYTEEHCITVKSDATVPTKLKMYADLSANVPSTLDGKLTVAINEGTGGTNNPDGSCTGFISTASKFSGTVSTFKTLSTFDTGLDSGVLAAGGEKQYKITVSLPADTGNEYQGKETSIKFGWETRSL